MAAAALNHELTVELATEGKQFVPHLVVAGQLHRFVHPECLGQQAGCARGAAACADIAGRRPVARA